MNTIRSNRWVSHCRAPAARRSVPISRHSIPRTLSNSQEHETEQNVDRRALLSFSMALAAGLVHPQDARAAGKAATRMASDFCPPATTPGFVTYTPDSRSTPAIRAGVITGDGGFYKFDLPADWQEGTILNILSGNFCMPKCEEPWYETLWTSTSEGKAQLIVSPLYRLVSKSNATLKDLGPPESVVERIGQFITGNLLEIEDVIDTQVKERNGQQFYQYEVNAPYAKDGSHILASFTIKKGLAYLFVVAANEKQWPKSEQKLRYTLESFTP